jgi:hypothetical protein
MFFGPKEFIVDVSILLPIFGEDGSGRRHAFGNAARRSRGGPALARGARRLSGAG